MAGGIAIIVLMVVINLFMIYAIVKTWERANKKVEKYFLHNASSFGPIREQVKVKEDFKPVSKSETIVKSVYVAENQDTTFYQNEHFSSNYKEVKENMDFSKREVVQSVVSKKEEKMTLGETVISLNKKLNFETVYELSTLASDIQLNILKETLTKEELELVDTYLETRDKKFEIVEFSNYIKHSARNEDPTYYVKTGWKNDNFDNLGENIKTVYDENITEGVKIVHKDKLYDYSI